MIPVELLSPSAFALVSTGKYQSLYVAYFTVPALNLICFIERAGAPHQSMLVIGGYLITYDQLRHIGLRRGLVMENGNPSPLNNDWRRKGIESVFAWPVSYPLSTETTPGVPGILIVSRRRDDHLVHLADCQPFEVNEEDLKVKRWLEINGIMGAPFVAIPDPLGKYNEWGYDYD